MVIIRIVMGLINAVVRVFVSSFLLLVSTAATGLILVALAAIAVLLLSGTLGFGLSRWRRK